MSDGISKTLAEEIDINHLARVVDAVDRIKDLDPSLQTVSIRIDVYPVVISNQQEYTNIIIGTKSDPRGISAFEGNFVFVIDEERHMFYLLPTKTMKDILQTIHEAGRSKKEMNHDHHVMTIAIPNKLLVKALHKTEGVQITSGNSS